MEAEVNENEIRGISLNRDLRNLLTDERFFDISLRCSDNVTVRACKNILAARSEVFSRLIFHQPNQPKRDIELNKINSTAINVVLEFLYAADVNEENLSNENIIEVYHAAVHLELSKLQKKVIKFTEKSLENENDDFGKKLLSELVEKFSLETENDMTQLLVGWIARIQLSPTDGGDDSLSLMGLQYLLIKTSQPGKPFLTYELDLLEYTIIKTKQVVSREREIENQKDPYYMDYEQGVLENIKNHIKPLLPHIDLRKIQKDTIIKRIEPLKIFSVEMILEVYRYMLGEDLKMQFIRGIPSFRWKIPDDDRIKISNKGYDIESDSINSSKIVMGNFIIKEFGIYEWDVLIEELSGAIQIGICCVKNPNNSNNPNIPKWVLGSDGYVYYGGTHGWYDYVKEGDVVNVTVNMNTKKIYFSTNNREKKHCCDINNTLSGVLFYPCVLIIKPVKGCKLRLSIRGDNS